MRQALALGLVALALAGCTRKAPGPAECGRWAAQSLGLHVTEINRHPTAREAYEERMTRCLTTPFDHAVLRCTELTGDARRCLAEFEQRRARDLRYAE